MSYVPVFAPDAFTDWREFSVALQEIVLDEVDRLAAHPPSSPQEVVREHAEHVVGGVLRHIFIRAAFNHPAAAVTIIGITVTPAE